MYIVLNKDRETFYCSVKKKKEKRDVSLISTQSGISAGNAECTYCGYWQMQVWHASGEGKCRTELWMIRYLSFIIGELDWSRKKWPHGNGCHWLFFAVVAVCRLQTFFNWCHSSKWPNFCFCPACIYCLVLFYGYLASYHSCSITLLLLYSVVVKEQSIRIWNFSLVITVP